MLWPVNILGGGGLNFPPLRFGLYYIIWLVNGLTIVWLVNCLTIVWLVNGLTIVWLVNNLCYDFSISKH